MFKETSAKHRNDRRLLKRIDAATNRLIIHPNFIIMSKGHHAKFGNWTRKGKFLADPHPSISYIHPYYHIFSTCFGGVRTIPCTQGFVEGILLFFTKVKHHQSKNFSPRNEDRHDAGIYPKLGRFGFCTSTMARGLEVRAKCCVVVKWCIICPKGSDRRGESVVSNCIICKYPIDTQWHLPPFTCKQVDHIYLPKTTQSSANRPYIVVEPL